MSQPFASLATGGDVSLLGESICPYSGVGCRLSFEGSVAEITRIRGVEETPANLGRICAKGAQLAPTISTDDRLTHPQVRFGRLQAFQPVSWDVALGHVAAVFADLIRRHG